MYFSECYYNLCCIELKQIKGHHDKIHYAFVECSMQTNVNTTDKMSSQETDENMEDMTPYEWWSVLCVNTAGQGKNIQRWKIFLNGLNVYNGLSVIFQVISTKPG